MREKRRKGGGLLSRIKQRFTSKEHEEEAKEGVRMRRSITLLGGISILAGTTMGSGIFISPTGVLRNSGSIGACLMIWVVGGLVSIMGALSFAELGILIPQSGGQYAYLLTTFSQYGAFWGPLPAFLFAWNVILLNKPCQFCIVSISVATYILQPVFGSCQPPTLAVKMLAGIIIVFVTALNGLSVKLVTRMHNVLFFSKIVALLLIIVGGIVKLSQGSVIYLNEGFEDTIHSPSMLASAVFSSLFAYGGWQNLNFVTEELQNPKRNLPLAIIISITIVTLCYLFANVSYFTVLSKEEFLSTEAVAVAWAEKVLSGASIIIPITVALSAFGAASGLCFVLGRLPFAVARDGYLPGIFEMIHVDYLTPVPSLILNMTMALIFLILGDMYTLIDAIGFISWFFYGLSMVSLLIMRRRTKDYKSKVPKVIPIAFLLICLAIVIMPISNNPHMRYLYAFLFEISSILFYIPFVYMKIRIPLLYSLTRKLQLMLNVIPTDYVRKT